MPRSLKVAPEYIDIVKLALQRNGFPRQQDLAEELKLSRDTVSKFVNGKPVEYLNFLELSGKLALDWRKIAGFGSQDTTDSQSSLDETKVKLREIEQQRQAEQPIASLDNGTLYNALLRLNFTNQVSLFRYFVETYRVGSCLIHGEPEYGQRWLLNRLVQLIPHGRSAKVISVDLSRRSRASYLDSLWRELRGRVGLPGLQPPQKIAEAICNWWQTQTVILVFQNVDRMPQEYMNQFLCEFWLPLVEISCNCSPLSGSYRLLMLLVDYSGCVEQWKIDCVEAVNSTWNPQMLVKLPKLNRLCDRDLEIWMETGINDLPVKLTTQLERTVQSILENTDNGLPELVLEYICSLCECNWYEWEQVWLKH
jgi:transcriptional regulator with XRE-family HTH domain